MGLHRARTHGHRSSAATSTSAWSCSAWLLATVIAFLLAVLVTRVPCPRAVANAISAIGLTLPSFALLGLLLPVLGIGPGPSVAAVTFYAVLPILRNAVVGLQGVDRDAGGVGARHGHGRRRDADAGAAAAGLAGDPGRRPRLHPDVHGRRRDRRQRARPRPRRLHLQPGSRRSAAPTPSTPPWSAPSVSSCSPSSSTPCCCCSAASPPRRGSVSDMTNRPEHPARRQRASTSSSIDVVKRYPGQKKPGRRPLTPAHPGRRDRDVRRPLRLRQDDLAEDDQPADRADLGHDHDRRRGRPQPARRRAAPPHRLRHPGRQPLPAHDGRAEHRAWCPSCSSGTKRVDARVDELLELVSLDAGEVPRPLPARALRRPAAARRRGPRPGRRPAGGPDGRAVRRGRPDHPAAAAGRADVASRTSCARPSSASPTTSTRRSSSATGSASCSEGAQIAQYDTPEKILAAPANRFVEDFVGAGSSLKQLTLSRVSDIELARVAHRDRRRGQRATRVARAQAGRRAGRSSSSTSRRRPRDWVLAARPRGRLDRGRAVAATTSSASTGGPPSTTRSTTC